MPAFGLATHLSAANTSSLTSTLSPPPRPTPTPSRPPWAGADTASSAPASPPSWSPLLRSLAVLAALRFSLSSASAIALAAAATVPRYSRMTAVHLSTRSLAAGAGPAAERVEAAVSRASACLVVPGELVLVVFFFKFCSLVLCSMQDGKARTSKGRTPVVHGFAAGEDVSASGVCYCTCALRTGTTLATWPSENCTTVSRFTSSGLIPDAHLEERSALSRHCRRPRPGHLARRPHLHQPLELGHVGASSSRSATTAVPTSLVAGRCVALLSTAFSWGRRQQENGECVGDVVLMFSAVVQGALLVQLAPFLPFWGFGAGTSFGGMDTSIVVMLHNSARRWIHFPSRGSLLRSS